MINYIFANYILTNIIEYFKNKSSIYSEDISLQSSSLESFITNNNIPKIDSLFDSKSMGTNESSLQSSTSITKTTYVLSYDHETLDYIARTNESTQKAKIIQYKNEIINLINSDDFIDGELSLCENYMTDSYNQGNLNYVTDALMEIYSTSLSNTHLLEGILVMISCVPYEAVEPKGQIMAMGLLVNKSLAVRDKAIQCFEKWNSKKGLDYLKNINCSPSWLQRYVDKVISYIERDGVE